MPANAAYTAVDPLVGTMLSGRYHVEERVGAGGMSTVYRATDTVLEREVALKVMHREQARDPSFLERFRQEARAVAQLSHPHIVGVIDAGEDEGHPYIVLEYVHGEDLKQRIRRSGALPVTDAVAYAIEIGRALQTAHGSNLVHRDIKPQNVLLDEYGHAKVTDFGIARSLAEEGLTEPGQVLGTTEYISPEQALGHEVEGQSDIYSLGIVLYEMLTGTPPFRGDTRVGVAMKHVREDLPNVQRRRPEISAALAAIVERATTKDTAGRYQSIGTMIGDLEEVLAYEVSRAGHSSEEATAVIEGLAGGAEVTGRSPFRVRHASIARAVRTLSVLAALTALGAAAVLYIGPELEKSGRQAGSNTLRAVALSRSSINDYDPPPGDNNEHGEIVGNVVDGLPDTTWNTEIYRESGLGKPGVGLVIDTGKPIAAKVLEVRSARAGYTAQVLGADAVPHNVGKGWTLLAEEPSVAKTQQLKLDTVNRRFRYYLLWIARLGGPAPYQASIAQLRLLH